MRHVSLLNVQSYTRLHKDTFLGRESLTRPHKSVGGFVLDGSESGLKCRHKETAASDIIRCFFFSEPNLLTYCIC